MTDDLSAIERRLERRVPSEPPPALRHRILTSIAETVPATTSWQSADGDVVSSPGVFAVIGIPGWAFAAAAVLGIVMTVVGVEALQLREVPTLAARLRAAGVADESLLTLVDRDPRSEAAAGAVQPAKDVVRQSPESRVIELHRLMEETL